MLTSDTNSLGTCHGTAHFAFTKLCVLLSASLMCLVSDFISVVVWNPLSMRGSGAILSGAKWPHAVETPTHPHPRPSPLFLTMALLLTKPSYKMQYRPWVVMVGWATTEQISPICVAHNFLVTYGYTVTKLR